MGFESIDQPGRSSEAEHNPKTSSSFLLAGEGWQMGFESINQPSRSSEVEHNLKMSISFFWAGEGWKMGFKSMYPYPFEIEIHQFPVQA